MSARTRVPSVAGMVRLSAEPAEGTPDELVETRSRLSICHRAETDLVVAHDPFVEELDSRKGHQEVPEREVWRGTARAGVALGEFVRRGGPEDEQCIDPRVRELTDRVGDRGVEPIHDA